MKKFLTLAALAAFVAAPAMANEKSPEEKQAKVDAVFAKADTDSNGQISKAEWTAMSDTKFSEADTNADGNVTKEEKLAAMEKEWAEKK